MIRLGMNRRPKAFQHLHPVSDLKTGLKISVDGAFTFLPLCLFKHMLGGICFDIHGHLVFSLPLFRSWSPVIYVLLVPATEVELFEVALLVRL